MVVCYIETSCGIFLKSRDLMNDVATIDVSDLTEMKINFPVLLCNSIKSYT